MASAGPCKSAPCCRQAATPAPHHSVFYTPDALPAAQSTASKHWRQLPPMFKYINKWSSNVCNIDYFFAMLLRMFLLHKSRINLESTRYALDIIVTVFVLSSTSIWRAQRWFRLMRRHGRHFGTFTITCHTIISCKTANVPWYCYANKKVSLVYKTNISNDCTQNTKQLP